jgi:L-fuculose-phosphate aldolase
LRVLCLWAFPIFVEIVSLVAADSAEKAPCIASKAKRQECPPQVEYPSAIYICNDNRLSNENGNCVDVNSPDKVCELCRSLHQQGFLAAADGNVSYRENGRVLITPSGVSKASIFPDELAVIGLDGGVLAGTPSSEKQMHLAVYNQVPAATAVVHAHPPHAIALSIARPEWQWLPEGAMSELILAVGSVPIVPYARPGTAEMGEHLVPFLPHCRAMILSRHGVLCWGESLEEAYHGVERLEHSAKILCLALHAGEITELPAGEVEALRGLRVQLGERIR